MGKNLPLFEDKTLLPTNKHHVSYSEVVCWNECSFRHKLKYIDQIDDGDKGSEHTAFGHAVHTALEQYLLNHKDPKFSYDNAIDEAHNEFIKELEVVGYKGKDGESFLDALDAIPREVPGWLDTEFPGWETVAAEFYLFEPIEGQTNKFFKGFMDTVIRFPKPPRKGSKPKPEGTPVEWEYWILDWKTTSWGWDLKKKTDKFKRMQLALYKHYWCTKLGIDFKQVKCGFVLLKRTAKPGNRCELVEISVGDKTREDALNLVSEMVNSIGKRMVLKNRNSCTYCKYHNTKWCP